METPCLTRPRILVADDQPDLLESLRLLLSGEGFQIETASGPEAVVRALESREYDLLLMDLNYTRDTTSGREGLDLLPRIKAIDTTLPVVVMTGWSTVELAVEAMRVHARDLVQKPWDNAQLIGLIRREVDLGRERRKLHRQQTREVEEARLTQRRLLPAAMPQIDGWQVATAWQPAGGVAGDSFDAIRFSDTRLGLCIADVVGKGMPAALLMSSLQASVKALVTETMQPHELCATVNRVLYGSTADGKFVSFFDGLLEAAAGTLTYANAGHNAPILIRRDGSLERLSEGGTLLGLFPDSEYASGVAHVGPGDRIILFTDGITEARDATGDEFGDDRLIALLAGCSRRSADDIQRRIVSAVTDFCGGAFQDDATLIVMAGA